MEVGLDPDLGAGELAHQLVLLDLRWGCVQLQDQIGALMILFLRHTVQTASYKMKPGNYPHFVAGFIGGL